MPRLYRLKRRDRIATIVVSTLMGALGLFSLVFDIFSRESDAIPLRIGAVILFLAGIYLAAEAIKVGVYCDQDRIEVRGLFRTRRISRSDIAGVRLGEKPRGPLVTLISRTPGEKPLDLPRNLETDAVFDQWISSLADLNAAELKADIDSFVGDSSLPGSRDEKIARLTTAKLAAKCVNGAAIASLAWLVIYPQPLALAFSAALIIPCVAVVLFVSGDRTFSLGLRRGDIGGNLAMAFVLPPFALVIYAVKFVHLVDWPKALVIAAVGGLALGLLILWFAPASNRIRLSGIYAVLVMTSYVYGAAAIVDQHWDSGPATVSRVKVLGAHVNRGSRSTNYRLLVSPWGRSSEPDEVNVERSFYEQVAVGDAVCIRQHGGALGIGWFEVAHCGAT
jgi:hypothetical protein